MQLQHNQTLVGGIEGSRSERKGAIETKGDIGTGPFLMPTVE
jgi:hypothetical protein